MKRKLIDISRCAGCRNCEAACAAQHSDLSSRNHVELMRDGKLIPQFCRHCDSPACVEACPSGALQKTVSGIVALDTERCAGCWMCVMSCPHGMIKPDIENKRASKCDGCVLQNTMACVSACPSGCLRAVDGPGPLVEYI